MLKRKFYNVLLDWKNNKRNECLLVNGARQIGKTYIIEQFGKRYWSDDKYVWFRDAESSA
ncbi:MAG: TniB family NTP-binding protein [Spirochaetales bacterium]|nr:TniB family NTP-binding protein [Spirochaetales bacterium]